MTNKLGEGTSKKTTSQKNIAAIGHVDQSELGLTLGALKTVPMDANPDELRARIDELRNLRDNNQEQRVLTPVLEQVLSSAALTMVELLVEQEWFGGDPAKLKKILEVAMIPGIVRSENVFSRASSSSELAIRAIGNEAKGEDYMNYAFDESRANLVRPLFTGIVMAEIARNEREG